MTILLKFLSFYILAVLSLCLITKKRAQLSAFHNNNFSHSLGKCFSVEFMDYRRQGKGRLVRWGIMKGAMLGARDMKISMIYLWCQRKYFYFILINNFLFS